MEMFKFRVLFKYTTLVFHDTKEDDDFWTVDSIEVEYHRNRLPPFFAILKAMEIMPKGVTGIVLISIFKTKTKQNEQDTDHNF